MNNSELLSSSGRQITDFFDRVYVVNLPERIDRRKAMVVELERAGMPPHPGKVELFPAIRPEDAGEFPSIGARGCFLSHLAILKRVKEERLNNVLIIEDDLAISEQFKTNQPALVQQLNQIDWGFVYFGHAEAVEKGSQVMLQPFSDAIMTTHFYGINGKILGRLLRFLEELQQRPYGHPDGGPMHLDGAYSTFRAQNPDIITLIAAPNLGWQRSSRSDIYPNKWYDRTPVVKQMVTLVRAVKGRLV